jgi:hypothetical protein
MSELTCTRCGDEGGLMGTEYYDGRYCSKECWRRDREEADPTYRDGYQSGARDERRAIVTWWREMARQCTINKIDLDDGCPPSFPDAIPTHARINAIEKGEHV